MPLDLGNGDRESLWTVGSGSSCPFFDSPGEEERGWQNLLARKKRRYQGSVSFNRCACVILCLDSF